MEVELPEYMKEMKDKKEDEQKEWLILLEFFL